jgi:membrane-bound lytic murein transglycosylase
LVALPDWNNDNLSEALPAFLLSCSALKNISEWAPACASAAQIRKTDPMAARQFFESTFVPWLVHNADGNTEGLVTGYYEPLLHGSRIFGRSYRFPVYSVPPDLLVIDLAETNPELKGIRLARTNTGQESSALLHARANRSWAGSGAGPGNPVGGRRCRAVLSAYTGVGARQGCPVVIRCASDSPSTTAILLCRSARSSSSAVN